MNRPTKPKTTDTFPRVYRGGCWLDTDPAWVRAARRFTLAPSSRDNDLGFRCALRVREPVGKVQP